MAAGDPMSRYVRLLRAYERRMLRAAIADTDSGPLYLAPAAELLGIHIQYLKARCNYLGGVLDDTPHEPPTMTAKKAHQLEKRKAERRAAREAREAKVDQPLTCCPRFSWGDGTHDLTCAKYIPDGSNGGHADADVDTDPEETHA